MGKGKKNKEGGRVGEEKAIRGCRWESREMGRWRGKTWMEEGVGARRGKE